jgi:hypothetical protein
VNKRTETSGSGGLMLLNKKMLRYLDIEKNTKKEDARLHSRGLPDHHTWRALLPNFQK